jgi:hypothetical protein
MPPSGPYYNMLIEFRSSSSELPTMAVFGGDRTVISTRSLVLEKRFETQPLPCCNCMLFDKLEFWNEKLMRRENYGR